MTNRWQSFGISTAVIFLTMACGRASFRSIVSDKPLPVNGIGADASVISDAIDSVGSTAPTNDSTLQPAPNPPAGNGSIGISNKAPLLRCPRQLTLAVGEGVRANLCQATDPDNDLLSFSAGAGTNCPGFTVDAMGFVDGRVSRQSCILLVNVTDGQHEVGASIQIDGEKWNNTIGSDPAAARGFFNQSDGALAIFNWQLAEAHRLVSLAFSDDKGELMAWDGRSKLLNRGRVIQNFSDCHPLTRSAPAGPLFSASNGNCGINLAAILSPLVPAARPWEKRYLRFAASNSPNAEDTWLSSIRTVANVPNGMSFIDADEWPQNEFQSLPLCAGEPQSRTRRNCRYDFAIDRFEVAAAISSTAPVDPANYDAVKSPLVLAEHKASIGLADSYETNCNDYPCAVDLSSRVDTTRIGKQANGGKVEWLAAKQLCLNRSYDYEFGAWTKLDDLKANDRFTQKTPTPLRKFHLLLDREFGVASWQTPDSSQSCQSDKKHQSGDPAWSACRSYYGVHDLFGNHNEMTDDILTSETNRIYTRLSLYNTQEEYSQYLPLIGEGSDSIFYTASWDLASMLPSLVNTIPSDRNLGNGDTFIWDTRMTLPYAIMRGGGETFYYVGLNQREAIGRYFVEIGQPLRLESLGSSMRADAGLRCALHPPERLLEKRHLLFLTSTSHNADLGGLNGADTICQTRAEEAGYAQKFIALLSDGQSDARSRSPIRAPVYSTRGQLIAFNQTEFWDDSWKMTPYYDEKGDLIQTIREIWTGSQSSQGKVGWKSSANGTAGSWTSSDRQKYPNVLYGKIFIDTDGSRTWLDTKRFGDFSAAANSSKRLLCISRETL